MLNKEDKQKQDLNWVNILGSSKYYYIDDEQLIVEIQHIFDSGANEIRIFEMVKSFIESRSGINKLPIHDVSGSFIQELAKEHINKCKEACYSSGSFAGNELEGDYGSWRDWEARLILFGRELLKNCL